MWVVEFIIALTILFSRRKTKVFVMFVHKECSQIVRGRSILHGQFAEHINRQQCRLDNQFVKRKTTSRAKKSKFSWLISQTIFIRHMAIAEVFFSCTNNTLPKYTYHVYQMVMLARLRTIPSFDRSTQNKKTSHLANI